MIRAWIECEFGALKGKGPQNFYEVFLYFHISYFAQSPPFFLFLQKAEAAALNLFFYLTKGFANRSPQTAALNWPTIGKQIFLKYIQSFRRFDKTQIRHKASGTITHICHKCQQRYFTHCVIIFVPPCTQVNLRLAFRFRLTDYQRFYEYVLNMC